MILKACPMPMSSRRCRKPTGGMDVELNGDMDQASNPNLLSVPSDDARWSKGTYFDKATAWMDPARREELRRMFTAIGVNPDGNDFEGTFLVLALDTERLLNRIGPEIDAATAQAIARISAMIEAERSGLMALNLRTELSDAAKNDINRNMAVLLDLLAKLDRVAEDNEELTRRAIEGVGQAAAVSIQEKIGRMDETLAAARQIDDTITRNLHNLVIEARAAATEAANVSREMKGTLPSAIADAAIRKILSPNSQDKIVGNLESKMEMGLERPIRKIEAAADKLAARADRPVFPVWLLAAVCAAFLVAGVAGGVMWTKRAMEQQGQVWQQPTR